MSTLPINLESFGAKTQKLWPKNRSTRKIRRKIVQVFLAITHTSFCSCEFSLSLGYFYEVFENSQKLYFSYKNNKNFMQDLVGLVAMQQQ